jgi:hypothetical protein
MKVRGVEVEIRGEKDTACGVQEQHPVDGVTGEVVNTTLGGDMGEKKGKRRNGRGTARDHTSVLTLYQCYGYNKSIHIPPLTSSQYTRQQQ